MTYWFVLIIPLVIMLFALFMERVEARLKNLTIRENEVEEFLEQAQPDEVRGAVRPRHRPGAGAVPAAPARRPATEAEGRRQRARV